MARRPRVLAMIMAGGKGERLSPLTRDRSKPAVPFGGRHRIVDFVLSNFINSGVLAVNAQNRIVRFDEKPPRPTPLPTDPSRALVSMGNYVFKRQPLVDALLSDARRSTDHDFGRSIIPEMVETGRVYAYDFQA